MELKDIGKWVESNTSLMPEIELTPDELSHLTMCLEHIHRWYYEGYPIGDFLTAIVRDEFSEACFRADDTNRKALYLYALFVHNHIGDDYKDKALVKVPHG